MKVIYGIGHLKLKKNSCVAVGVFDGLHRGHQLIINKTVALAKEKNLLSVVLTFYPHPDSIIKSKEHSPLLISLKHRLNLISLLGVDVCIVVKFDSRFRDIKAKNFIWDILIKRCRMKHLIVSREFNFGKDKEGNVQLLEKLARNFSFKLYFQKQLKTNGRIISSTLIRSLIWAGDLETASELLSRKVEVMGTVVGGDRRGKRLGFPTANIDPHHEVIPPKGAYLIQAYLNKRMFVGLANIGFRPTFKNDKKQTIELHLLNFNRDIYRHDLRVVFLKRLRSERKFRKKTHLIEQIKKDIRQARLFFSL